MAKSVTDWLREGEEIYAAALKEYHDLEARLDEMERQLLAKQEEVNQLAQIIGKPPVESQRRVPAQLVEERVVEERSVSAAAAPSSPVSIARALAGRSLNR